MLTTKRLHGEIKKVDGFWEVWMPVGVKCSAVILRRIGRFHTKAEAMKYWKAAQ